MSVTMGIPIADAASEHPGAVVLVFISGGFRVNAQSRSGAHPK